MRFEPTTIAGAWVVRLQTRNDARGWFARSWCADEFAAAGLSTRVVQQNLARSAKAGTLRGLHYQKAPHAEVKIVRCTRGAVHDVVVDLRPDSPTRHAWFGIELTAESGDALYIPEGCAHGYVTLQDDVDLMYSTSATYAPAAATGVRYDDPAFGIRWPFLPAVISDQDLGWALVSDGGGAP